MHPAPPDFWVCLGCSLHNPRQAPSCLACDAAAPRPPIVCVTRFMHGGQAVRLSPRPALSTVRGVRERLRQIHPHGVALFMPTQGEAPLADEVELASLVAGEELGLFALPLTDRLQLVGAASVAFVCTALRLLCHSPQLTEHGRVLRLLGLGTTTTSAAQLLDLPEAQRLSMFERHLSITCDGVAVATFCELVEYFVRATAAVPWFSFRANCCQRVGHYSNCVGLARAVALGEPLTQLLPLIRRSPGGHCTIFYAMFPTTCGTVAALAQRNSASFGLLDGDVNEAMLANVDPLPMPARLAQAVREGMVVTA
jgi:hypothetical protein